MNKDGKLDQLNNRRCRELLVLLRKITQAIDLHSKHLDKNFGLTGPQLIILQELLNGGDKRCVMITLSEKCRHILDLAPPPLQETFADSFTQLEEWEQLMILSSMNRIVDMMSAEKVKSKSSSILVSGPVKIPS
jgi:hypothetical protein